MYCSRVFLFFCISCVPSLTAHNISDIIKKVEQKRKLPTGLLTAIGKVESGLTPYVINHAGVSHRFSSEAKAVDFIKKLTKQGKRNFSVGCFQLHYKSHINKFKSDATMINPQKNIEYAAKLLQRLYMQCGRNWNKAVKRYHSACESLGEIYARKVTKFYGKKI